MFEICQPENNFFLTVQILLEILMRKLLIKQKKLYIVRDIFETGNGYAHTVSIDN